jgi:hypothetical protein
VRCGRCGNDNAEGNRFCGMCGAPLAAKTESPGMAQPTASTANIAMPRQAAVPAQSVTKQTGPVQTVSLQSVSRSAPSPTGQIASGSSTAERRVAPVAPSSVGQRTEPVIAGPSFLGLSTPGPASDRHTHSHAGRDPLQPSSANLDYLLDDEEEPKRGSGKLILVVVALALALGFGYLRWKQGGFDWLNASNKKPAPTSTSDAVPNADSGAASSPDATAPHLGSSSGGSAPAAGGTAPGATDSSAAQPTPSQDNSQTAATQNTPAQNAPTSAPPNEVQRTNPGAPNVATDSAAQPASSDSEQSPPAESLTAKATARKPAAAKPTAARPYDSVAEAERYIYGRGVRQDCDHGMRLLRPAAQQSSPKAMISLGALYSTGTCTPRDLPTAYRWFALALHKQPDNQALQDDLKNLWEKMTQPERQLAIKLSQ